MSKGILGNMFDLNRDGDLDWMERAAELSFIQKVLDENNKDDDDRGMNYGTVRASAEETQHTQIHGRAYSGG